MNSPDPPSPGPSASSAPGAFDLLHPAIQRRLWQMQWATLRPMQSEAIRCIMQTPADLVVAAATASGKTEAAFLPILSQIAELPAGSVRALYVGPLKALINDQFQRVADLCANLEVPVYHWHGDVPAAQKAKLAQNPAGVLLITPESLESIFVNRSERLADLFGGLRFVVIDELHAFLDGERGLHLRSLLSRLKAIGRESTPFRTVGLSATLGDPADAQTFINRDQPASVRFVRDASTESEFKMRVYGYRAAPLEDEPSDRSYPPHFDLMGADLVSHCHGYANLVFANAKWQVESLADRCQRIAAARGLVDRFLVHHGSLSAELREDAEAIMKSGAVATTFCSSTLEMGIDIGAVKMVGQVGAPGSVASLKQRVGRSGRRGEPRILRMYIDCEEPRPKSSLFDRLHLDLIQAIAATELMLAHWVEPPAPARCDLSTLTQQIISLIAQTGGLRADRVYDQLCRAGAFREIDMPLFVRLLRQLSARQVIEQAPEGDLILGLLGERLRKDKGFYAVFPTPEQFAVLNGAERIGTVSEPGQPGERLLLGGRRWQVSDVDRERHLVYVHPASGWKSAAFTGGGGAVHPEIRQAMKTVLGGTGEYSYLDAASAQLLHDARAAAAAAGVCAQRLISLGPSQSALITWTGSRIQQTLVALFGDETTAPEDETIALTFKLPLEVLSRLVKQAAARDVDPLRLAESLPRQNRRKYDWLLDVALAAHCTAVDSLDLPGARALLHRLA